MMTTAGWQAKAPQTGDQERERRENMEGRDVEGRGEKGEGGRERKRKKE